MNTVLSILVCITIAGVCTLVYIGVSAVNWLVDVIEMDEGDNKGDF